MDIKKFCVTRSYTIMEVMQVFERNIGDCETGLVFDVQKRQTPDFVGDKQEK